MSLRCALDGARLTRVPPEKQLALPSGLKVRSGGHDAWVAASVMMSRHHPRTRRTTGEVLEEAPAAVSGLLRVPARSPTRPATEPNGDRCMSGRLLRNGLITELHRCSPGHGYPAAREDVPTERPPDDPGFALAALWHLAPSEQAQRLRRQMRASRIDAKWDHGHVRGAGGRAPRGVGSPQPTTGTTEATMAPPIKVPHPHSFTALFVGTTDEHRRPTATLHRARLCSVNLTQSGPREVTRRPTASTLHRSDLENPTPAPTADDRSLHRGRLVLSETHTSNVLRTANA